MTQDEIMELAEQADLADKYGTINYEYGYRDEIIAFAKLVAEKEREACAMLCLWHNNTLFQKPTLFHMAQLIRERGQA